METIRKSQERGKVDFGWLKSFHSFSFGHYYDPNWMGFQNLRVINDDYVAGENGFDFHPHKNMEIITFMLQGELTHQDSMGNKEVIRRGDIQVMTAGTGVMHSEWNYGKEGTKLLQIWVLPNAMELKPRYEQINFQDKFQTEKITMVAGLKEDMPIKLNADVNLYHINLAREEVMNFESKEKGIYIHVYNGSLIINDKEIQAGDAYMVGNKELKNLTIKSTSEKSQALIFELFSPLFP